MDKYQKEAKRISKELSALSTELKAQGEPNFHNEARRLTNLKYGKSWRENLDIKSVQEYPENHKGRFQSMSYY